VEPPHVVDEHDDGTPPGHGAEHGQQRGPDEVALRRRAGVEPERRGERTGDVVEAGQERP
jgi:hypothetical protein